MRIDTSTGHRSGCRCNMWILLGLLLAPIISADDAATTVYGLVGENVILQCNCSNLNSSTVFSWQKKLTNKHIGIMIFNRSSVFKPNYKGRVKTFENDTSCSIELINITAEDQGTYQCYYDVPKYDPEQVHLEVPETLKKHLPIPDPGGGEIFRCDVHARNTDVEIQWRLNGTSFENSSDISIFSNETTNALPGIRIIKSTLVDNRINRTSKPECIYIQSNLDVQPTIQEPRTEDNHLYYTFFIVPIALAAVLSLLLCRRKIARQKMKEEKMSGSLENVSVGSQLLPGVG